MWKPVGHLVKAAVGVTVDIPVSAVKDVLDPLDEYGCLKVGEETKGAIGRVMKNIEKAVDPDSE